MSRSCSECSAPISRKSTSGRCRGCVNRGKAKSPEHRAKIAAGLKRYLADPTAKAKHVAGSADRLAAWRVSPEGAAALSAQLSVNRPLSAEGRRRQCFGWCPASHAEQNRYLIAVGYKLAERKAIILADVAAIEKRRVAALSPLERQLEKVRAGARLIDKPILRRVDHAFSLTGNATGML